MPLPVLTVIIFIFIIWLQYEIRKSARHTKDASNRFWDGEKQANLARRKDISDLNYLKLNTDTLPLKDKEDETINSYRDTVCSLADRKILNLNGISNTELKNTYGIANINLLMEYDNNFVVLVSMLQKWAERLYNEGYTEDALSVLEYAVTCGSDVHKTYRLLADIYKQQNKPEKISELIRIVSERDIHDRQKLTDILINAMNT